MGNGGGSSIESYIEIRNRTNSSIKVSVQDVDSYDWDGVSRPDNNLDGQTIGPKEVLCEREELNRAASSHMMTLILELKKDTLVMRIDQGIAIHGNFSAVDLVPKVVSAAAEALGKKHFNTGGGGEVANIIIGSFRQLFTHKECGLCKLLVGKAEYHVQHEVVDGNKLRLIITE